MQELSKVRLSQMSVSQSCQLSFPDYREDEMLICRVCTFYSHFLVRYRTEYGTSTTVLLYYYSVRVHYRAHMYVILP